MNGVESGAQADQKHAYVFRLHPQGAYHATVEFEFSPYGPDYDGTGKPGLFWYLRCIEGMLARGGVFVDPGDYLVHECVACRREKDQSYTLSLAFDLEHGWLFDPEMGNDD